MKKISRNELCPCGSGLKYKKCCFKTTSNQKLQSEQALSMMKDRLPQQFGKRVVIMEPPHREVKMSEVILEFVDDLLQQANTDSRRHAAVGLACTAWNLALLDEIKREEALEKICNGIDEKNEEIRIDFNAIINRLIQRKLTYYTHINRYILDYQSSGSGKNLKLNIVSSVPN